MSSLVPMSEFEKLEAERDALRALILSALKNNGGPVAPSDTIDSVSYVMVRREDFDALESAMREMR